ncbi:putative high molecular mass nuclear antigen [Toxoplasma gondii p89]|uniref:Putative high molecular mass nuclear antigen n=1 Tax=Toxoplasma gondii p89 TaxID=943119 RepID=A0A086L2G7_TOXGO|nr:putative high molecular mass nuclear antigen [Toxoplasma gondii p89]
MRSPPASSDSSPPPLPSTTPSPTSTSSSPPPPAPPSAAPPSSSSGSPVAPSPASSPPSSGGGLHLEATPAPSRSLQASSPRDPAPLVSASEPESSEADCGAVPSPLDIFESILRLCECGHSDFVSTPRLSFPSEAEAPPPRAKLGQSIPLELPEFPLETPSRWRGYRATVKRQAPVPARSLSSPVQTRSRDLKASPMPVHASLHAPSPLVPVEGSACDSNALCCCSPNAGKRPASAAAMPLLQPSTRSYYYYAPAPLLSPSGSPPPAGGSRAYTTTAVPAGVASESFYHVANDAGKVVHVPSPSRAYEIRHDTRQLTVPTLGPAAPAAAGTGEAWGDARRRLPDRAAVDRDSSLTSALLRKEAELQALIEEKRLELRLLERQANARRIAEGTSELEEVRHLRGNLCEKEMEVEQLRAEVNLARKEKGDLSADLLVKDAVINALKAGEDASDLPGVRTIEAVKTLREKEDENRLLTRRLEALREERRDMRELLLQKDKQLAAAMNVSDPETKEASAVQLGVQAIAMVQDSVELREKIKQLNAQVAALKEEKSRRELLLEETFRKLTDKRKEAAGLLEMVSQRDMKLARVETFLQQRNRDYDQLQEQARASLKAETERAEKGEEEIKILEEQQNALKNIVASRDEKVMCLQNEVVRRDARIKQLDERLALLSQDLEQTSSHLQQLLRASAAKDAYLYELESQLRRNEVERQASYLAEVARTRRLALETRLKEEECRVALNDKDEALASAQHELSRNALTLQQLRQAFATVEATDACYRPAAACFRGNKEARTLSRTNSLPFSPPADDAIYRIPTASSVPQRPLQESLRLLEVDNASPQGAAVSPSPTGILRPAGKGDASALYTYKVTPTADTTGASPLVYPSGVSPQTFAPAQAYAGILRGNGAAGGDTAPCAETQGRAASPTAYATLPVSRAAKAATKNVSGQVRSLQKQ